MGDARTAKKRGRAPKLPARRKQPIQERSQRRLDAIVEAAAESFAKFGFEATTMEGIAAAAGTSIGSLYQFFPNKRAVFREVASRALAASAAVFAGLLGPGGFEQSWAELVDDCIDGFFALQASSAPIRAIFRNMQLYGDYEADDRAHLQSMQRSLARLLASWVPDLAPSQRATIAAVVVSTVATALLVVSREPPKVAVAMIAETKLMVRSYLAVYLRAP